ncbi:MULTISPECIES: phage antirepressor KilAC domain-containing protein [unclassified Acinetobacter]|uniref:phage antirepressor KilAC domain-containing protein n=1 Tax=unclassified Acinetobacter TaxID=196816 RepID=UPI003AF65E70
MLAQFGGNQKRMSHREVAELTGKEARHVKRDCEVMFVELGLDPEGYAQPWTHPQNSQTYIEYMLTRDLVETLITGYSIKLRHAVLQRWRELESQVSLPSYAIDDPIERAKKWIEEEKQKQAVIHQLEIAAPKVAFVDKYVAGDGNKTFRQVAKLLQIKEYKFREFLESNRIMYKLNGEWTAYQNHVDARRFHVKTGVSDSGHAFNHALFTPKGIEWIAGELAKFNLRGVV